MYAAPTLLFHGGHVLQSRTGVQQGDPLGPMLFALGLLPLLQTIKTECPDLALSAWILDDGTLIDLGVNQRLRPRLGWVRAGEVGWIDVRKRRLEGVPCLGERRKRGGPDVLVGAQKEVLERQ